MANIEAQASFILVCYFFLISKKVLYWHKNESVNKLAPNIPNMRVKNLFFSPLCCFFPFCPLSWVLGELADNSHKSSDLGEKLLVNMEWNFIFIGLSTNHLNSFLSYLSIVITLGLFSGGVLSSLNKEENKNSPNQCNQCSVGFSAQRAQNNHLYL